MKLGWRNPRANTLQGPDAQPLKDLFGDLQKFMTWPHCGVVLSGSVGTTVTDLTLTVIGGDDPHGIVRANGIDVPHTFKSWLAVGEASGFIGNAGVGRYLCGWRLNGVTVNASMGETHAAHGLTVRAGKTLIRPVKAGDRLTIGAVAPGATTMAADSEAYIFFLPLA